MSRKMIFTESTESGSPRSETSAGNNPITFEINLFDLIGRLLKWKKIIFGASFGITIITAVLLFMQPNLYTSTAIILPSGKSDGNMSALKNLVGLSGSMMMSDENSSSLFPVILQSNLIADELMQESYAFTHKGKQMTLTLPEYFDQADPDLRRKALRDITTIEANQKTGEIALGVETAYPGFSQAILAEYLRQLEDFNLNRRQSSAKNNEEYLARQLEANKIELEAVEDALEEYQLANLDWAGSGSPEIMKELTRLRREVEGKSSAYIMLQQQYEMAKFDAQKDVPIVRTLDTPSLPSRKSGPFRRNIILMTGLLSLGLISFMFLLWEIVQDSMKGKNRQDFDTLQSELRKSFPRANRAIARLTNVRKKDSIVT